MSVESETCSWAADVSKSGDDTPSCSDVAEILVPSDFTVAGKVLSADRVEQVDE